MIFVPLGGTPDLVESGTTQSWRLSSGLFYNSEASNLGTDFRCEPLRMRISRGTFLSFQPIFNCLGQFRFIFVADFPLFVTSRTPRHGILAN
jgi:hypothetical protein